jgi:hypothetical protein
MKTFLSQFVGFTQLFQPRMPIVHSSLNCQVIETKMKSADIFVGALSLCGVLSGIRRYSTRHQWSPAFEHWAFLPLRDFAGADDDNAELGYRR